MISNLIALQQSQLQNQLSAKLFTAQKQTETSAALQSIFVPTNSTNEETTARILAGRNIQSALQLQRAIGSSPIESRTPQPEAQEAYPIAGLANSAQTPKEEDNLEMQSNLKDDLSANRVSNLNTGPMKENCGLDQSELTVSSGTGEKRQSKGSGKMGRWTAEEKERFIEGLKIYGKDWKKVERFIGTRSGAQIRSHAQKFFINVEKTKKMDIDQYINYVQKLPIGVTTSTSTQQRREQKTQAKTKQHTPNQVKEEDKKTSNTAAATLVQKQSPQAEIPTTPVFSKMLNLAAVAVRSHKVVETRTRLSTNFDENSIDVTPPAPKVQRSLHSESPFEVKKFSQEQPEKKKQDLQSFIDKLKNQMILNAQKQVKVPCLIKKVKPATLMVIDNSKQIKILETKRQQMHLEFLDNLDVNQMDSQDSQSQTFIGETSDKFSELQGDFLKILNKELAFYTQQLQISGTNGSQSAKDLVNPDILKNMIEILNMQILLKLSCRMMAECKPANKFDLKSVSPIDTTLFRQLVPKSYISRLENAQDQDAPTVNNVIPQQTNQAGKGLAHEQVDQLTQEILGKRRSVAMLLQSQLGKVQKF